MSFPVEVEMSLVITRRELSAEGLRSLAGVLLAAAACLALARPC